MAGGGVRASARCRHTVPDWARYARAPGGGWPIFAACHLLVKADDRVDDPRTIACGYWGRQPECPFYEGPGAPAAPPAAPAAPESPTPDVPVTARQMVAARLTADDHAPRGPLTEGMRQRRRASAALLGLLAAMAFLAAWWLR
ncbi:MAG TPA: hypothetical protein VED18_00125 [Candidatus Sulfotelmatobacter sp.]|nr:hypothetical protein [Candidatus Sulfotelmatobacter sp.]